MKKYFLLVAVFLLSTLVITCKSTKQTAEITEDIPAPVEAVESEPSYQNTNQMLGEINNFSFSFFKRLSKGKTNDNISFSPASLNMALAVVYTGARAETKQQMSSVLGFDADHAIFHPRYHAWFSEMMAISKDTLVEFNIANRVFLENSFVALPQYISDVERWHGGAFGRLDFRNDSRGAEQTINQWVEEITRNRIKNLIPPGSLNELTRLVLVNALYIKSKWKYPFSEDRNIENDFTTAANQVVTKTFMTQKKKGILYYETDEFMAIELPYTTSELSLIIIRPNDTHVPDISEFIPSADGYNEILEGLQPFEVRMEIPPFKIESQFSLNEQLKKAGMEHAFDERADFSGINGEKDLLVSNVFQKVFFEIDEEGTEAAAATGAVMVTTSMPVDAPQPKEFIANRPFLFILKENKFNTPLFIGQYVK